MYHFYVVVFLVGVLYTLVSLVISGISGAFHAHGDFGGAHIHGHMGDGGHMHGGHIHGGHIHTEAAHSAHMHGHSESAGDGSNLTNNIFSWLGILLNPLVAVSFLTVFGGMGIMGTRFFGWNPLIVLIVSLGAGIIISILLYNFVAKPIYRSENSTDASRENLIGIPAEVTTDILENGFGTIKYTVNSLRYTAPARHIENKPVKQGEKVFICKIENNIFFISELSQALI
ncbi:MAG TPA: NfeD family protein [Ruminiclostridium sp.]|nr:NfeD family protein [Ruminiclostridium sp.]